MIIKSVLTINIALALSGCATILNGTKQSIFVSTVPQGATVSSQNDFCVTPCSILMSRKYPEPIGIRLDGYDTIEIPVKQNKSNLYLMNLVNVIGLMTDAMTQSYMMLEPASVTIALQKKVEAKP